MLTPTQREILQKLKEEGIWNTSEVVSYKDVTLLDLLTVLRNQLEDISFYIEEIMRHPETGSRLSANLQVLQNLVDSYTDFLQKEEYKEEEGIPYEKDEAGDIVVRPMPMPGEVEIKELREDERIAGKFG